MTYCVGIRLRAGLVLLADTRTNAGVDNISRFRKLHVWTKPGDRVIAMMTSGNLAITQAVITRLQERNEKGGEPGETLFTAPSMFRVAELVGDAMREVQDQYGPGLQAMSESSLASIVVAGQRRGGKTRLFLVYAAGNFIEATEDTPYFQVGEHKYGKPILDRVIGVETSLEDAKTAALLSMDSTLRSNLTVGMPLDLAVIPTDALAATEWRRIDADDPGFHTLSQSWSELMREAFVQARLRVSMAENQSTLTEE